MRSRVDKSKKYQKATGKTGLVRKVDHHSKEKLRMERVCDWREEEKVVGTAE